MLPEISKIKGVHPGAILNREFEKRGIRKSAFAIKSGIYHGIITDITRLRRGINASLAIKLEEALGAEEGYFMVLQAYYKIRQQRIKEGARNKKPDLYLIRKSIFWDADPGKMDFSKRKRFIIERIFERGNDAEINEIIRFYGKEVCTEILKDSRNLLYSAQVNAFNHLGINIDKSRI